MRDVIDSEVVVARLQKQIEYHVINAKLKRNKIPCQCEWEESGYICAYCHVYSYLHGEWPPDQWRDSNDEEDSI